MALAYGDFFPVAAGDDFYADQLNFLRTAISRRAAQVGATVTLPAVMADNEPIDTDDELFRTWLDAARTAVEVFIGDYCKYASSAFAVWTKATLLGYVHTTWPTACTPSDLADTEDWYQYSTAALNEFYIAYINEIYYACECLCFHDPGVVEKSKARQLRIGTGTDGDEGGTYYQDYGTCVPGASQSGITEHYPVTAATPIFTLGDYLNFQPWLAVYDPVGDGVWQKYAGDLDLVGGSINYATGAWTLTASGAFTGGDPIKQYYLWDAVDGSYATAMANAWTAWTAAGYAGTGASWEAKGHLHAYIAYGDTHRKTGVVENYKVTDAQVTVPALDYPDTELYLPTQRTYMPVSPAITLAVGSLVGEVEDPAYHYVGWLKVTGDFDNEDVQVGPYYFDISSGNFHFDPAPPYDEACLFEASPTGVYGRCGFGGYCNGEYNPLSS